MTSVEATARNGSPDVYKAVDNLIQTVRISDVDRTLKNCETCGDIIRKEPNRNWNQYAKKRFCSRQCCAADQSQKIACKCYHCKTALERSPSHYIGKLVVFCSVKCRKAYFGIERPCDQCRVMTRKHRNGRKYNGFFCSMKCLGLSRRKHKGNNQGRRSPQDLEWKKAVLKRAGYKCAKCGTDRRLEAHHIKPLKDFPELRHDIKNGLCVCHKCHYYGIHGGAPNYIHGKYAKPKKRAGANV